MESILEQPVAPLPPSKQLDQTSIHLLPCGIQHEGKANISSFFFLVNGQYPSSGPVSGSQAAAAAPLAAVEKLCISSSSSSITTTTTTNAAPPEVSFRGRTLKGTVIPIPEGYIGTVYKSFDHHPTLNDKETRDTTSTTEVMGEDQDYEDQDYEAMLKGMQEERKPMKTQAQFKEFTMWGQDEQPTLRTEKVLRAMHWIDIAKVLHEPLC